MSDVYRQIDHEMHRTWFGLYNIDDPTDSHAQGFLKASITVVGPGDKAKPHDAQEDAKRDREMEASGDVAELAVMPTFIKREMRVMRVQVHMAEDLPVMDAGALTTGIQAYARVNFAGSKLPRVRRKDVRKASSKDRVNLRPKFHQEFCLPVAVPSLSTTVGVGIWDRELGKDNCVAHTLLDFKEDVLGSRLKEPTWFNRVR